MIIEENKYIEESYKINDRVDLIFAEDDIYFDIDCNYFSIDSFWNKLDNVHTNKITNGHETETLSTYDSEKIIKLLKYKKIF